MYSLADLFKTKISFNRRIVILDYLEDVYDVFIYNIRDKRIESAEKDIPTSQLQNYLSKKGIKNDTIIAVIHPYNYSSVLLHLPFKDKKRIEAVLKSEVEEVLPFEGNEEIVMDYINIKDMQIVYSVKKSLIEGIVSNLGVFSKNLKSLLPVGAVFEGYLREAIGRDSLIIVMENNPGIEVWGYREGNPIKCMTVRRGRDGRLNLNLFEAYLYSMLKYTGGDGYSLNCSGDNCDGIKSILGMLDVEEISLNVGQYNTSGDRFFNRRDSGRFIVQLSVLKYWQISREKSINLLKGEFKPDIGRYIRVKDLLLVGFLFLIAIGFSASRFFIEVSSLEKRVNKLENAISDLGKDVFGREVKTISSAEDLRNRMKEQVEVLWESIDRRESALDVFREFTSSLPVDVDIEYSDILIDNGRIIFTGKTKAFSDIDKIKESLQVSDYFKEVKVVNSGTTGSTGGYTVNFQFEITWEK